MKRIIFIFTLALFYLAACTNSDAHTHNGNTHTHDNADHTHSHEDGADHSHSHDDDHSHSHEQEEFTVEADSVKQDSSKSHY